MPVLDQPCAGAQSPTSSEANGASVGDDAPELGIVELDSSEIRSDEDDFVVRVAVLGAVNSKRSIDVHESDLLRRIWRAYRIMRYPYAEITAAANPFYMKPRVNQIIASMKLILILMDELDRHRQMVVYELHHKYGVPDCTILRNNHGITLIASDQHLEDCFSDPVRVLDKIISQCRDHMQILHDTDATCLRGTDSQGRRFGPDRREWEFTFRRLVISTEGNSAKLRLKMREHRRGLERAAAARRNKELEKTPSAFSVAQNVPKATGWSLQ